MNPSRVRAALLTTQVLVAMAILSAQQRWNDPTTHTVQFVTVDQGVRLEVLDWGGTGRPVVLLTGSGHTAHVYDEFAPKLTDCCHETDYQPKNEDERTVIEQFAARGDVIIGRWIAKVKRGVPDARVVYIPRGGHYLWATKEADVVRELHAFIAALPKPSQ